MVGSAESLLGRVLQEEGLGKFCDPGFLRATQREIAEAFDMTAEELDRAAHRLLEAEKKTPYQASNNSAPAKSLPKISRTSPSSSSSNHPYGSEDDDKYKDTKL